MTRRIHFLAATLGLAVGLYACSSKPSETDQKIAELQKELEATRQELAARADEAGAAASAAAQTASEAQSAATSAGRTASAAVSQSAETRAASERASEAAAAQAGQQRAATERALAEQKAATDRTAGENARLRAQIEDMKPREFTLPAGTIIPVRTTAEISTKTVKNGSVFEGLLERDLVVDGTTLAQAGSRVTCLVVSSDPGGRVKGVASLSVAARSIAGAGGNTLNIRTGSYSVEAGSTKGRDAARTGIAAGAGAVIGAIAGGGKGAAIGAGAGAAAGVGANLATRGEAAVIPTETLIEFPLSAPATVVIRK